ncbi:hypothetical protein [Undibacterium sp. TJN19]|uniref:hypothetical protein n=1 Tax=Undibacterium sp. TJN19 TaxID=3413055 RepID=UPI003BF42BCB
MPGFRQSALLLHGLSVSDQRWILERLAADDQKLLREHLAELKDLGIPADSSMLNNLGISADGSKLSPTQAAAAADMLMALKDEPIWLLKQVLSLENWHWKQAFLAGLTQGQKEKLQSLQIPALSVRAQISLRAYLIERLNGNQHEHADLRGESPVRRGWVSRILKAIKH